MEEIIDNPKKIIWKNTSERFTDGDFNHKTIDEIKDMLDECASKFPLNKCRLAIWDFNEDYHEYMVEIEALETDEEYQKRLLREEESRNRMAVAKKIAEVKEYNDYLKLKEKYEKNE